MLTTKTSSITLKGTSSINADGNNIQAVTMSATISEVGHSSVTASVINQQLYEENKVECRADIDAFTNIVRKLEDVGVDEITSTTTETENV